MKIKLKQVEAYAMRGLTKEQIAAALGIRVTALGRREKKEFREAVKTGKARGIELVTNKLLELANSGNTAARKALRTLGP